MILGFPLNTGFWIFVLQLEKYLLATDELENKVMRKFSKSCKPVVICYGKILVVGRITQFNYIKGIMCRALRVRVTLRDYILF